MKIRDHIEYAAAAALLTLCRILPEPAVFAIYRALGLLTHALMGRRRRLALQNVNIAFPEKPADEQRRIVKRHFLNLAESMALNALIMSGRISKEEILEMVEGEEWEAVKELVTTAENGVIFFSAHLGNWELMPQYAALTLDRQLHVIARKSNNALLEERVIRPLRERFGVSVFYKRSAMMNIMKACKRGDVTGLMIDQRLNMRAGIPVKFFGKEAGTTATPALLQIRFGIPTIPYFIVRTGRRKYRVLSGPPVPWEDNGKPREEQVAELTAIHQKIVEETIRKYPDQWFWVHDRWGLRKKGKA